jgi:hypothetical protein
MTKELIYYCINFALLTFLLFADAVTIGEYIMISILYSIYMEIK